MRSIEQLVGSPLPNPHRPVISPRLNARLQGGLHRRVTMRSSLQLWGRRAVPAAKAEGPLRVEGV
jgi:hypothetical protein